jgi:hypothetical protein
MSVCLHAIRRLVYRVCYGVGLDAAWQQHHDGNDMNTDVQHQL